LVILAGVVDILKNSDTERTYKYFASKIDLYMKHFLYIIFNEEIIME